MTLPPQATPRAAPPGDAASPRRHMEDHDDEPGTAAVLRRPSSPRSHCSALSAVGSARGYGGSVKSFDSDSDDDIPPAQRQRLKIGSRPTDLSETKDTLTYEPRLSSVLEQDSALYDTKASINRIFAQRMIAGIQYDVPQDGDGLHYSAPERNGDGLHLSEMTACATRQARLRRSEP